MHPVNLPMHEYVSRRTKLKIANRKMADFMYALVMTRCQMLSSLGVGIYAYSRAQNMKGWVEIMVSIHPSQISRFEETAGVTLLEPIVISPHP